MSIAAPTSARSPAKSLTAGVAFAMHVVIARTERHDDDHEEDTMKAKRAGAKDRPGRERVRKDLVAKKSGDVRGGVRDAASGLPTGKRTH
jgi:hypothetical protein